jgi:hypothetical protein
MVDTSGRQSGGTSPKDFLERTFIEWREPYIRVFDSTLQLLANLVLDSLATLNFERVKRLQHQLWCHLSRAHNERSVVSKLYLNKLLD